MEGGKTASVLACVLAAAMIAATGIRVAVDAKSEGTMSLPPDATVDVASGAVQWWFDPTRGTVCWNGLRPAWNTWGDFIIDLDRNHDTGFTSYFGWWDPLVGNFTQHRTWDPHGAGTIRDETDTNISLMSLSTIRSPYHHIRFSVLGTLSEWFHPFVTKRTPPTDWILGLSDDDGNRSLPITKPFWVSFDFGKNWTEYDPASYTGPTGVCQEDLGRGTVRWWFDTAVGSVCWIGRRPRQAAHEFIIDLDGVHSTGFSSAYLWRMDIGNYTLHMTWMGFGGSSIGDETGTTVSVLSEVAVYPPWPHVQFSVGVKLSEWFHPFVTKRTPPTNWVLGISDDDGQRALPIHYPFWISLDGGKNWTEYDPSAFTGPTGECREELKTITASIDFDPDTLNPRSQGKWVTVYIELPQGYDPRDINATTIRLNDTLAPVLDPKHGFVTDPGGYITDHDGDGIEERMVKFDRAAVIALLPPGTYPVRITGALASGTPFKGLSEPIRVLNPSR